MAITWHIARMSHESLQLARKEKQVFFDILTSTHNVSEEEHDAGWLYYTLWKIAEFSKNKDMISILKRIGEGDELLSEKYPSGDPEDPVWDSDITILYPKILFQFLSIRDFFVIPSEMTTSLKPEERLIHKASICNDLPMLLQIFQKSIEQDHCIVQWWD